MNGTKSDFDFGKGTNVSAKENETIEQQTDGNFIDFERIVDSASQNQVIRNSIDNKIRKAVDNAVMTVENGMHDATLTAMDKVVIPRAEMAVRSFTGSTGRGPYSLIQNLDHRDFTGNTKNTPLMSASSRLDLNIDQDRINETRGIQNFELRDFPALKPNRGRRAHFHHMVKGHNAPQKRIPEFLTGRPAQNNPLPQQLTQRQIMATHISPDNTLPLVEQTQQRQNSDSGNPINRLAVAIAGIASRQRTQTSSALFKPTTTNTLVFAGKNEEIELFDNIFQTFVNMQPEMSKAMKNYHFHSHLRKKADQTFRIKKASNKPTLEDELNNFRPKYVRQQSQATTKQNWHKLTFNPNSKTLTEIHEEPNECFERRFGPLAQQTMDSLLYAKLSPHPKQSINLAYLEKGRLDQKLLI